MSHGWTPAGDELVAVGCAAPPGAPLFRENAHLYRVDASGETPELCLTAHVDRCTTGLTIDDLWGLDYFDGIVGFSGPGEVMTLVSDTGKTFLGSLALPSEASPAPGDIARVVGGADEDVSVVCFDVATGARRVAFITTSHTEPARVEVLDLSSGDRRCVGWPMESYCAATRIRNPVELTVASGEDGERVDVQAWLLLPEGDGPHPLLLDIHGGPCVQFGNTFFHELQLLCARGYAVLYANPRGSQGYGRAFSAAIHPEWGPRAMTDLMACVDHVLEHHPIDSERLGVLGGSYGGYMTNWIIAHTGRFKSACTQRTVSSMEAMIWSDFGFMFQHEMGASYREDPELYRRLSPVSYADRMNTPLLIMQGLGDQRTPRDQGERLFAVLRGLGKPAEMVLFPGADHNLSRAGKPEQRIERLNVLLEWFERTL